MRENNPHITREHLLQLGKRPEYCGLLEERDSYIAFLRDDFTANCSTTGFSDEGRIVAEELCKLDDKLLTIVEKLGLYRQINKNDRAQEALSH